ncbi:nematode cuticle collagen domain protein, partial [Ancylostoma duodenale]
MALALSSMAAVSMLGSLAFVGFILSDIDDFVVNSNDALKEFEFFERAAWNDMLFERPMEWRQRKRP